MPRKAVGGHDGLAVSSGGVVTDAKRIQETNHDAKTKAKGACEEGPILADTEVLLAGKASDEQVNAYHTRS